VGARARRQQYSVLLSPVLPSNNIFTLFLFLRRYSPHKTNVSMIRSRIFHVLKLLFLVSPPPLFSSSRVTGFGLSYAFAPPLIFNPLVPFPQAVPIPFISPWIKLSFRQFPLCPSPYTGRKWPHFVKGAEPVLPPSYPPLLGFHPAGLFLPLAGLSNSFKHPRMFVSPRSKRTGWTCNQTTNARTPCTCTQEQNISFLRTPTLGLNPVPNT